MRTITVGELRRNPSDMVAHVESGQFYELTKHNQRVGFIVPAVSSTQVAAPRTAADDARTGAVIRHELRSAATIDQLLESDKGDW